jgi:hypothetical protein
VHVLKKVGFVTAGAIALSLVAAPAFAATTTVAAPQAKPAVQDGPTAPWTGDKWPDFGDAYNTFIWGGGALGAGAAALVAGAFTGIADTPALVLRSVSHHG